MSYLVDFEVLFYGKNIAKKTFVFLAVLEFSVANNLGQVAINVGPIFDRSN